MKEQIKSKIQSKLNDIIQSDPLIHNAYLLIQSAKKDIHWKMASGMTGNVTATADQPYPTASLGKMFTAVIITMLAEEGKLKFNDRIVDYLSADLCKDLHIYKGRNYSDGITIKQC